MAGRRSRLHTSPPPPRRAVRTTMRPTPALLALVFLAALTACEPTPTPPGPAAKGSRWAAVEDLVRKKDLPAAYAALEAMRVPGKADADLARRLAEVRRLQGEPVKGILLLREGLAADPKAHVLVAPLAALYLQVGDNAQARATLEQGREAGAASAELSMLLGQAYGRLDLLDLALRDRKSTR